MTTQAIRSYCDFSDACDVSVWYVPKVGFRIESTPARPPSVLAPSARAKIDGPMKAAFTLMALQRQGLRVPESVIKQLIVEARSK